MKFPIDLSRATPSQGQFNPIQAQAPDLSAPMKASQELGQTIEKSAHALGSAAEQFKVRQDKFNYTVARSRFVQDSINLQNELENNPDYINSPAKYQEKMSELKQKYTENLSDNRFAPLFKSEMNIYEAKSLADINKLTSDKLFYSQQAEASQILESNLNVFTKTKDPVAQQTLIHGSIEAYANSIPDNDPKKPLLIQEYRQATGKRFAETALVSMSPSQQISVLTQENQKGGSTIASFLPADQRQDWLQKAELLKEKQDQVAVRQAERMEKQNQINKDKVFIEGLKSNLSFDQLPTEVKLKASKEEIDRYENLRLQQIGGKGETDEKQLNFQKYQDLYVKNPEAFANVPLAKIASEVPFSKVGEVQKWHDNAFSGARAPVSIDEKVEVGNKFVSYMGLKSSDSKALTFKRNFEQEINYFKDRNGRDPSKTELEKIGNDLITEKTFSQPGFFFGEKWPTVKTGRAFTLDKQDTEKTSSPKPNDQEIEEIQTGARKAGKRIPTREEIENNYPKLLEKKKQSQEGMKLSYAFPQNAKSAEDLQRALEDEASKQPWLFENRDLKKESQDTYKRYYKNNNIG